MVFNLTGGFLNSASPTCKGTRGYARLCPVFVDPDSNPVKPPFSIVCCSFLLPWFPPIFKPVNHTYKSVSPINKTSCAANTISIDFKLWQYFPNPGEWGISYTDCTVTVKKNPRFCSRVFLDELRLEDDNLGCPPVILVLFFTYFHDINRFCYAGA